MRMIQRMLMRFGASLVVWNCRPARSDSARDQRKNLQPGYETGRATGDAHRAEHLASWKTLLPCDREPAAVIAHLRSRGRFFLIPFALERRPGLPIAA
jgi:hypothetical protein